MPITLKNLAQATPQQVYNQVAAHLMKQNEKSQDDRLHCKYRQNVITRTLKCAAGCLIGDEEYQGKFEGQRWSTLAATECVPNTHLHLVSHLQDIHDRTAVKSWGGALRTFFRNIPHKYAANTRITLANLNQATAQQVFDQVALHLFIQNERSGSSDLCYYRRGNLQCAAGCLLSDGDYDELSMAFSEKGRQLEGRNWYALRTSSYHDSLIRALQSIHDRREITSWPRLLKVVAAVNRLSDDVVRDYDGVGIFGI